MAKNLADSSVDLDHHVSVTTPSKMTLVPQLKRWLRKEGAVTMELNNHLVQVNLLKAHVKMIVWDDAEAEMYVTMIGSDHQVVTYSIMALQASGCPPPLLHRLEETVAEIEAMVGGATNEVEVEVVLDTPVQ